MISIPIESATPTSTIEIGVELLNRGSIIVTDTQRLKHLIDDAYNLSSRAAGRTTWETAPVFTWDNWLRNLWQEYQHHAKKQPPLLLQHSQTKHLWEDVIARDIHQSFKEDFEYLLWNISSTASNAKSAYQILCDYQISRDEFRDWMSEDVRHFLGWMSKYESLLKRNHWIDSESLSSKMILLPDFADLIEGLKLAFVGFSNWTPQQQLLLEWLQKNGATVQRHEHSISDEAFQGPSFGFEDLDQELETCARWARATIEANPEAHQVGIVIPGISDMQVRVRRMFSSILNPDSLLDGRQPSNLSFHVTVGTPLASTPLVVDSVNLLELTRSKIDIAVMQDIITSDRIKDWSKEWENRFLLADALVTVGGSAVTIKNVVQLAIQNKHIQCPRLIMLLQSADRERKRAPKSAYFSFWGRFFVDWLARFTETEKHHRKLSFSELQAHKAWMSALDSLSELGIVSSRVSADVAMAKLTRSLREKKIQPQAARVPIQIGEDVSMLGQSFTHMWILNMNNEIWPGSSAPNPFIPRNVQKSHKVPNSSPEILKQITDRRMSMLFGSSRNVVRSYARSDGGDSYQPSPMLGQFQEYQHDEESDLSVYKDYQSVIAEARSQCEYFSDWKVRGVEDLESLRSGRLIIKNQSNCPFRAFAEHRLNASALNSKAIGFNAMDKGSLAHRMFERIYDELTSKSELIQCGKSGYQNLARMAGEKILKTFNARRIQPLHDEWVHVELNRLVDLAGQWFDAETSNTRLDFEVIAREKNSEIDIEGMLVRIRIDRIDETSDGKILVIDYKTGRCNLSDISAERPKDPQLMVYACAMGHVNDVVYAQVKRGEVYYKSLSRYKKHGYLFQPEIDEWRETLSRLAKEFLEGKSDVDPLPRACEYCHLDSLCRIGDTSNQLSNEVD